MGRGFQASDLVFEPAGLPGAFRVRSVPREDERGSFVRLFSTEDFRAAGLEFTVSQSNLSTNPARGTLRGMHYQADPHGEAKVIRCARGRIYDVAVDLRPSSSSFKRWIGVELSGERFEFFYLPPGLAHGFLTLEADVEVEYLMSDPYVAESARGVRWDDPAFGIEWPEPVQVISERDRTFPDFDR